MTDTERVIQALKTVPEKQLLILDLASELLGEDGQIDYQKAAERLPEVNLAIAEANAYYEATSRAVRALKGLQAR